MERKHKRAQLIFLLLAAYVLFQFTWWAFHIVQLHGEVRDLQLELLTDPSAMRIAMEEFETKVLMVIGEGAVFVTILFIGLWRVQRYIRKEAALARQEQNFMLSVTHELKTPIASLRLFMETLTSRKLEEERKQTLYRRALNETYRLDRLVENILLSTRFEQKAQDPHFGEVNFTELSVTTLRRLDEVLGEHHTLQLTVDEDLWVKGDQMKLESLISNLFENAIKYAPEGSTIEVVAAHKGDRLQFRCKDEGVGIAKEEKEKVFTRFYRVGNEETRKTKGTGLGLYLVRSIAAEHGGEVKVDDNPQGGAIFTVNLPLMKKA